MPTAKEEPAQNIQRSILVLLLALSVVVLLTAAIFESGSAVRNPAAPESQRIPPSYQKDEALRARDRAIMFGQDYLRRGQLEKAEAAFGEAYAYDIDHPQILQGLGTVHFRAGHYDKAVRYFLMLRDLLPEAVASYTNLAIAQLMNDQLRAAQETVQMGMLMTPAEAHGPIFLVAACLYQINGEEEQAGTYIGLAEEALGEHLPIAAGAGWAAPLREHPRMAAIIAEARGDEELSERLSDMLPNAPQ